METNFLKTIICILEEGGFQKAAKRLNCSQSTVTFHVQQVERELSVRLFEKNGRRMVLTNDGKNLLPHIQSMLRETEFIQNYGKSEQLMEGVLKVGVPDELYCYGFDRVIDAFHKKIPNIRLIAKPMQCQDIQNKIINNELDIGIHCNIGGYSDPIIVEEVSWFHPVLIAAAKTDDTDYLSYHQRKDTLLITSDPGGLHIKRLEHYLQQRDICMGGILEMGSAKAVKINVMSGLGIACFPDFVVHEELQTGEFIKLNTELDGDIIPVVCVCHKNTIDRQDARLFREIIREVLFREGKRK